MRTLHLSLAFLAASLFACGTWFVFHYRIRPLPLHIETELPFVRMSKEGIAVEPPSGHLLGRVGVYDDELTAYLHFEYLRGLPAVTVSDVLMTTRERKGEPVYDLYLILPPDLIRGTESLAKLEAQSFIPRFRLVTPPGSQVADWQQQTKLFIAAYNEPVRQRLLTLPAHYLTSAVAKFILFKRKTDNRVRQQILPVPAAYSEGQAAEFAADMIDVARFYQIPLSMLLGVGAMENNFLDVRGDLKHAIWKRRAQPGDIVLKRRRGRVLVSNYSTGPWQITRETLRYVHQLYLHDKRDYSLLPPRLRPPKILNLDQVNAHELTTYAGLLLRTLLDHFDGDVQKAVGAYNGGIAHPNERYATGVELVAAYAQRVLSLAAARKGIAVSEAKLVTAPVPANSRAVLDEHISP